LLQQQQKMKISTISFLLFVCFFGNSIAQPTKKIANQDNYAWQFGASCLLTDDDGYELNPFSSSDFHSAPYPTRIFVDKYIYNGWSTDGAIGFQKYDPSKLVNDSLAITGSMISTDFALKYSFYKQLGRGIVDPYIGAGVGVTLRTSDNRNTAKTLSPTANFTVGSTFWMSSKLGLQVQGTLKLGLTDLFQSSDYMQYSIGLTYRIAKTDGYKSDFDKSKYKISSHRTRIKVKKPKSES
jgi:hypothetical protein